jgi:hypothetical protein
MLMRSWFGRLGAVVCALSGVLAVAGCGGSVATPKAYVTYHSTDGRFDCDCPKGWETDGGGKPESPNCWAKLSSGNAEIKVNADFAGSLFGDMAKAGQGALGADAEPPVARVHPMGERAMKEEYSNYQEREPKEFQSKGFGEGRRSTFIADGGLGGKTYGYRATLLANDRRITVICSCPSNNFQALKPAFERVIASVRQGGGK